jgi:hypothetical protein
MTLFLTFLVLLFILFLAAPAVFVIVLIAYIWLVLNSGPFPKPWY